MTEIDVTLSRVEDSVVLPVGEEKKSIEYDDAFVNYFFFSASSIDYTASTMTLKYDTHTGWTPRACLVICVNDPNGETYAIRITTPKFSSSSSQIEYRNVYTVGIIHTSSPHVSSSYNLGVKTNGCPAIETFVLSYETFDNDIEKPAEYNPNINFNVEYIISKNIEFFSGEDDEHDEEKAEMLNIVSRKTWNNKDSDFDDFAHLGDYTQKSYNSSCNDNQYISNDNNAIVLGSGFFKSSGGTFNRLNYSAIYTNYLDSEDNERRRVDLVFNEPLEAIGYHTFYLGRHYNNEDVPDADNDDYIGYDDGDENYNYFPGSSGRNIDEKIFFDGKLSCSYEEQYDEDISADDYIDNDGAKRWGLYNQNEWLFDESYNIKSIKTGRYLKIIGNQAFKRLKNLEYIDFESSPLERIGMFAFEGCTAMTSFNMLDTVSLIGEGAFKRSGIESITIPSGLKHIEEETFRLCKNLASVDFSNCTGLTKISSNAFRGCSNITSLNLPTTLRSIERMAFGECSGITSVNFNSNSNLKYIGYRAFDKCYSLASISIPAEIIENRAFEKCRSLTSVTIESSVRSIGERAFYDSAISSLTIENGITSIGEDAFRDCYIHIVEVPNSVTQIGGDAFDDTDYVLYTGSATGSPWGAENHIAVIENNLTYNDTGKTQLHDCIDKTVVSVTIPNSVVSIDGYAFSGCENLSGLNIGNHVATIGYAAFSGCYSLLTVNFPSSVRSIGISAFSNCRGLQSITLSNGVTDIGNYAFSECSGLTNVSIPNSVTYIGNYSFYRCDGLTSIAIPNNVTTLGEGAFASCSDLASITIGSGINKIQQGTFADCVSLTSVVIPNNITRIEISAFNGCTSLSSVQISTGVTYIAAYVFSGCTSLNTIRYDGTVERWRDEVTRQSWTWHADVPASVVICSNGTYPISD